MKAFLTLLGRDTRGATTIEYAMILGMIVLAIITAVQGLGSQNGGIWANISSKTVAATQTTSG